MNSDELVQAVNAYCYSRASSLDGFEEWFRTNSRGMFGDNDAVLEASLAIESAFSDLRYSNDEQAFREELLRAIRPFVNRSASQQAADEALRHAELISQTGLYNVQIDWPLFPDAWVGAASSLREALQDIVVEHLVVSTETAGRSTPWEDRQDDEFGLDNIPWKPSSSGVAQERPLVHRAGSV